MKRPYIFILSVIVGISVALDANDNADDVTSELLLSNIEALADEEKPKDFWCCGTSGLCVIGPGFEIVGKLSDEPCQDE